MAMKQGMVDDQKVDVLRSATNDDPGYVVNGGPQLLVRGADGTSSWSIKTTDLKPLGETPSPAAPATAEGKEKPAETEAAIEADPAHAPHKREAKHEAETMAARTKSQPAKREPAKTKAKPAAKPAARAAVKPAAKRTPPARAKPGRR